MAVSIKKERNNVADFCKKFKCSKCLKVYKHKAMLTKHIKYYCNDDIRKRRKQPGIKCQFCKHRSHTGDNLLKHLFLKHGYVLKK